MSSFDFSVCMGQAVINGSISLVSVLPEAFQDGQAFIQTMNLRI